MSQLIYTAIVSLDGYICDTEGNFDWSMPDEEVHAFVNESERSVGTYLLGRKLYEVLVAWEHMDTAGEPQVIREYAEIWCDVDKVVYSTTLTEVRSANTRLESRFDPEALRALVAAADRDVSIGGAHLAAQALRAGLVNEIRVFQSPVIVGGGTHFLPDDLRVPLRLIDQRRFDNGVVYLAYGVD